MSNEYVGPLRNNHGPMSDSYFNLVDEDDIWSLFRYEISEHGKKFNVSRHVTSPACVWLIATNDDITHK